MSHIPLHKYNKLTEAGEDSDSSGDSIELPPTFREWLEEHGYTMRKELRQGILGTDFLVMNTDGDSFVVKQMNYRDEELVSIQNQVEVLKTLNHGYIVSYEDSFEDKKSRHYYVVMEYYAGGDLYEKMQAQKEKGHFEEQQILDWLFQICLALLYLHEKDVPLREITPKNVFLTEDNYINIGGLLKRDDKYEASVMGAPLYISPEYYLKKSHFRSDIWSLGWLLHDLCMLDVWSNNIERHCLHALSLTGKTPPISDWYSEDLRELITQMLSCDPKDRPTPDEILKKPFLSNTKDRNCTIPEALEIRLIESINAFNQAYNEHFSDLEILVCQWGETTDSIESKYYNATAGSLSGSVIGAAGGIIALVGAILTPFTFGASLIVTGVGIGVGLAGGVVGATSSVIGTAQQKELCGKLQEIEQAYKIPSEPIFSSLITQQKIVKKVSKFKDVIRNPTLDRVQWNVGSRKVSYAAELINLGVLANVSRIAAQSAKVARVAAAAVSGVISSLLIILDIAFIVKDSQEIHQMRKGNRDNSVNISSKVLKSIIEMRKTHKELSNALNVIKETREALQNVPEIN